MAVPLLPTTLVGSYPQPDWLIDKAALVKLGPPRVRAREVWRIAEPWLEAALDDATLIAIRDQERAGVDIITDGEIRRESYSNRFATALDGVDLDNPGATKSRSGAPIPVPRVVGKIRRRHPVQARDAAFLRANTDRQIKMTLPGPFTLAQQAQDEFYGDDEAMACDYADAVNAEIKDLFAAGVDIVQLDEPWMEARPEQARRYGIKVLNRALEGVAGTIAVHMCFGYAVTGRKKSGAYPFLAEFEQAKVQQLSIETAQPKLDCAVLAPITKTIILGVLDLGDHTVETPQIVADRIRQALPYVPAERIVVAPDCGMKYLPRDIAYGKLRAMVEAAAIVRREVG